MVRIAYIFAMLCAAAFPASASDGVHKIRISALLTSQYPNAKIICLDQYYDPLTRGELFSMYRKFKYTMREVGLNGYVAESLDCDKWARLFTSHVVARNALSDKTTAKAIGELSYLMDNDTSKRHMVNVAIIKKDDALSIQEVDSLSGGFVTLGKNERESAWRILF